MLYFHLISHTPIHTPDLPFSVSSFSPISPPLWFSPLKKMAAEHHLLFILLLFLPSILLLEEGEGFVGVNIGTTEEGSEIPPADKIVDLLLSKQITHVRLVNADPLLLRALSRTGIQIMVGVAIDELQNISRSPSTAASWIRKNIIPFTPSTNITSIAVACNFFSGADHLLPAINNLQKALISANLDSYIKISTPTSIDLIPKPFPPSEATFNSTLSSSIAQLLQFLSNTHSPFMLNAYPYNGYTNSEGIFPLDYALARPSIAPSDQVVDPNTLLVYSSMLEAMVDAAYYSMEALNFSSIPVVVTETGWPWASEREEDEPEATVENSEEYSRNLVGGGGNGTPRRPGLGVDVYIYEMFSHERRHEKLSWGMLFSNGSEVYSLRSFNGSSRRGDGGVRGEFCVAMKGADEDKLREGIRWACGKGKADCDAIQKGRVCFYPDTPMEHASYAYNQYYQKMKDAGGTCDFGGTAHITAVDPSKGSCIYAGSGRVNSTIRRGNKTSETVHPVTSGTGEWRRRRRRIGLSMLLLGYLHGGACLWFFGVT